MIHPLYLFSYWIFAWFVLWMLVKMPPWASPFLALALALLENVVSWLWLLLEGASWSVLGLYAVVIVLMKVFPLALVFFFAAVKQQPPPVRVEPLLVLFVIYCVVVMWSTGESPWKIYVKSMNSMLRGTSETPLMHFFTRIYFYK